MRLICGVCALVFLITGCSLFKTEIADVIPNDNLTALERQNKLRKLTHWGLKGRISVRSEHEGGNASLVWEQRNEVSEVSIFGAFGMGAIRLVQNADDAVLYRSGEKPLYGENAQELLLWETGMKIPVSSMSLWLKGLPGNGRDVSYDSYGRLRTLFYTDEFDTTWAATFERYRDVDGHQLPVQIRVEGNNYVIKLRTHQWDAETQESDPDQKRLSIPGISS